jgi:hypothetical protein
VPELAMAIYVDRSGGSANVMGSDLYNKLTDYFKRHLLKLRTVRDLPAPTYLEIATEPQFPTLSGL